jgi:D-alanyl-D-alanine carboxypeptidase/D-alanyl-D-alanine-endopeptidase (penicillin-binding protein 4)
VTIENAATTGSAASAQTLDVVRDGDALRVTGSIPAGKVSSLDAAVPDPAAYVADLFARALAAHGVTFDPPFAGAPHLAAAGAGATVLWTHDSDPLARMLQWFWFRSDNLVGESLLKTIDAAASGAPGTSAGGVRLEQSTLRALGVDPSTLAIVDGSGLSRYDALTPRGLVGVLQSDWHGSNRSAVVDALPLAGLRGSLRGMFIGTPAEGRLYAKSGSMTHVWNLAGYVMTRNHGAVTFALMSDDYVGSVEALFSVESSIFAALVDAP